MRFLVDAQLPPALARKLAELGQQADHVQDLKLAASADRIIWQTAIDLNAVIMTKDVDFVRIGSERIGPQVVWLRLGNVGKIELLSTITRSLPQILQALEAGERIIEVHS